MDQGPLPAQALPRMDRDTYRAWVAGQHRRYELLDGVPVAMNAERRSHAAVKGNVFVALRQAVRDRKLPCEVIGDGFTVEIGPDTDFEPDAQVNCGEKIDNNALAATNPVIVVEVLSPSTRSIDTGRKLSRYFQVASIQHYLVIECERRSVVHHRRDGARIATEIVTSGAVTCDPPGLSVSLDQIYEDVLA